MSYVQEFISENISSYPRLVGTEVEGYPLLTHKKKGDLGELIVGTKMKEFGYSVTPSDIYNGTWDKRIDGVETEIKLSVGAKKDDTFIINHVKRDIKWERFIFYGYNIIKPHRFVWCSKEDMEQCWEETNWWKNQSSPEERIISGANVIKWINSPYCREILTWKKPNKIKTLEYFM